MGRAIIGDIKNSQLTLTLVKYSSPNLKETEININATNNIESVTAIISCFLNLESERIYRNIIYN